MSFKSEYKDCYVILEDDNVLRVGNNAIERTFLYCGGVFSPISIRNRKTGAEWLTGDERSSLFQIPDLSASPDELTLFTDMDDDHGLARKGLLVHVDHLYRSIGLRIRWRMHICPGSGWIRQELQAMRIGAEEVLEDRGVLLSSKSSLPEDHRENKGETLDNEATPEHQPTDYADLLPLHDLHCRYEFVRFRDRTDRTNNFVSVDAGLLYLNEQTAHRGSILFLQRTLTTDGLIVVKESPAAAAHLHDPGEDFRFEGKRLYVPGCGFRVEELTLSSDHWIGGYGTIVGVYDGGEYERLCLLQDMRTSSRVPQPTRDFTMMSNTWGDRSRDGRITEAFLIREIEIAARLGLTHVQLDDGWQQGRTVNSVQTGGVWSSGMYAADTSFWMPHPQRLPNGLQPITEYAARLGIRLGLWFSPDGADHYGHWEQDAQTIIRLHEDYGIEHFKLDGVKIESNVGEANLVSLMRRVVERTKGKVCFNLDATSGVRPGFIRHTQYGCIFLENRYTDNGSYYPHWSLRNLWLMAKYIPTHRLQIEFLNGRRNTDRYGEDPLAPDRCGIAYSFAVALFANPLAWMELTGLENSDISVLKKAIQLMKPIHSDILSGHVLPIGEEPSGTGWTGFQSIISEEEGYLLLFRERHPAERWSFTLWESGGRYMELSGVARMHEKDVIEGGDVETIVHSDACARFSFVLPNVFSFALYRYRWINPA